MATLGDKVTETIVNALGKGLQAAGMSQHDDLKSAVAPRVEEYLSNLDPDSVEYKELSHLTSNTSLLDVLLMLVGSVIGLIMSIFDVGGPYRENLRHGVWERYPTKYPDAGQIITATWRGVMSLEESDFYLRSLGFAEGPRQVLRAALREPLRTDDIRDLLMRGEINAGKALDLMKGAGLGSEEQGLMLKLFWRLPGVQDLIRMAVKEAFTPEIAAKFGQYADLPAKFVELAAKQGISAEVAGWYWAAHWDLPSTTQGYEMLHRGVIQEEELDLLLRAQDVMPWWRDKLKAIAYSPLTRVDVRRMYHLGVLTEAQVVQAYKDLGYNQANADKLLEFTKSYYGPEDEDPEEEDRAWTKAEILDGYRKKIITTAQARTALQEMGYADAKIDFYLAREDLKAVQTKKEAYIDRWHSLYINGIAGADDVYSNLDALGITKAEVDELLPLWHLEKLQAVQRPTKAERTKWLKAGIITEATWTAEMQLDGYSDRYISWYLAEIKEQPSLAIQSEEEAT